MRADLAESPVWDADTQKLWFIDIFAGRVHRFDPTSGTSERWDIGRVIGSIGLRKQGGLVMALDDGFYRWEPGEVPKPIALVEADIPWNRFNDGRTDRAGNFWAGSLHRQETEATGGLYRLSPDGCVDRICGGLSAANGLAFAADGDWALHADSKQKKVWKLDLSQVGEVTRREHLTFDGREGVPDGAAIDSEGAYWLTMAGGWRIARYRPDGTIDRVLHLPVEIPTSVTFGDPDLCTLYITTATYSLSPESLAIQALAGSILSVRTEVPGVADVPFDDRS